jgi:hypothetical protein
MNLIDYIETGGPGSGRHPYGKEADDISSTSAAKVKQLITTGGPSNSGLTFTDAEKAELQKTVLKDKQTLYRGIGVIESRLPLEYRKQVNALKVGDQLPEFLKKGAAYDSFASYTKKKGVANSYAEGKVSIVVSADVPKSSTLVDLENYEKLGDSGVASLKDDHDYLKSEKEVLVDEQHVTPKIVSVKGTLNVPRTVHALGRNDSLPYMLGDPIVLSTLELDLANQRVDRIRKMSQSNLIQQQKDNTRKQGTPVQIQPMKY